MSPLARQTGSGACSVGHARQQHKTRKTKTSSLIKEKTANEGISVEQETDVATGCDSNSQQVGQQSDESDSISNMPTAGTNFQPCHFSSTSGRTKVCGPQLGRQLNSGLENLVQ